MRTRLDDRLFALMDENPEWSDRLSEEQVEMLQRRRQGATLSEIAAAYGLTKAGVRLRLYGRGSGARRGGGILGQLRGLARRKPKHVQTA